MTRVGLPAEMRVVEIAEPGGPEVLRPAIRRVPRAGGRRDPDPRARGRRQPARRAAARRPLRAAAGRLRPAGARGRRRGRGGGAGRLGMAGRRRGLRAAAGRRLCRVRADPRGARAAGAARRSTWWRRRALCETFFTVWTNVFGRGRLEAGESLLVHGGSSGIGTTAIQLARARGARVFATAGSEAKCRGLPASSAPSSRSTTAVTDFVDAVRDATAGRGVDVILDMVGGDYLPRDVRALALGGAAGDDRAPGRGEGRAQLRAGDGRSG